MPRHALFIQHKCLPGKRDAVISCWMNHMASAIQANADHVHYTYSIDSSDPDGICAFQEYVNEAAASAFLKHPAYFSYIAEVEGLLAGPPQIRLLTPLWSKVVAGGT